VFGSGTTETATFCLTGTVMHLNSVSEPDWDLDPFWETMQYCLDPVPDLYQEPEGNGTKNETFTKSETEPQ